MDKTIDYYPYGWRMSGRVSIGGERYRFGYQGQFSEYDPETGYNHFEARLLDTRIGRWLTTDPAGQFFSPYVSMENNPVNGVDPDGRYSLFGAIWRMFAWGGDNLRRNKSNGEWGFTMTGIGEKGLGIMSNGSYWLDSPEIIRVEKGKRPVFGSTPDQFPLKEIIIDSYLKRPGRFGSPRGIRKHAGSDLYAPIGTEILSIRDGIVMRNPSEFYKGTFSIEVDHGDFIGRYTELNPVENLKKGSIVTKGQILGTIAELPGLNKSMLHFEMYSGALQGPLTNPSNLPYKRRADIMDPTGFLQKLQMMSWIQQGLK